MIGVNKVILVGNLGADPEIRRTQDGRSIANLRVATTDAWRDKASGERRERTEWHRVAIFNENLCKVAEQYLHKGSKVYVEGQLQTRDNAKMRTPKQGITDDQAQARRMEQRVHAQAALSNAIALVNDAEFILDPVGLLPCCTNFNRPRDYPGHDLTYINAFPDLASEHRLAGGGPDEGSAAGVRARGGTATQPLYGRRKWLTMPEKGLMQAISAAQRRRSILIVFQAL